MSTESAAPVKKGRSQWLSRGPALALLVLSGGAAFWLGYQQERLAPPNGGLVVPASALNFGTVWEQKDFVWELPIENPTDKEVKIERFVSSCTCQKVEPESMVLPPGGKRTVRLTLDLRHYTVGEQESEMRRFAVQLLPLIDDQAAQQRGWQIGGRVRVALTASPREIDFGTGLIRGQRLPEKTIQLTAHVPVRRLTLVTNRQLAAKLRKAKGTRRHYELTVVPRKDATAGEMSTELTIEAADPTGKALPPLAIRVTGQINEPVQAVPGTVVAGSTPVGGTITETVVLQSLSGNPFRVVAVKSNSADVKIVPRTQPLADCKVFQISQQVAKAGHHRSTVELTVRALPDNSPITIRIPVSYIGTSGKPHD